MTSKVIEGHKGSVSLREFKKILPNTCIYELILIKIYMNYEYANILLRT